MKIRAKNMVPTQKSTVFIFLIALAAMLITYITSQTMVMKIELGNFIESIRTDTKENIVAARNLLDGMVQDLEHTSQQIQKYDNMWSKEARAVLKFSQDMNLFDVTFISDAKGNAYEGTGYMFNVSNQEYFQRAVETKKVVFSEILPSKRFNAIQIIAFPMLSEDKEVEGVLFGLFKVETFSQLINNVVDVEKKIYVVDSNGTYINCFLEEHTGLDHGNFWDVLECYQLKNMEKEELKEEFRMRKEGDFSYRDCKQDIEYYGYHMPLGIEDWQIVLTGEETIVNTHVQAIRHVDMMNLIVNTICSVTMLICIYSYFKKANRKIIAINQKISKNNEMLRMAVEHSNYIIFEYDIQNKIIETKTEFSNSILKSSVIYNVPEYFLTSGIVDHNSVEPLKKLFETIENEKSCQADIQFIGDDHEKIWLRISMYKIYNEDDCLIGIVGSAEDVSMLKKGEDAIKRKEEMYKSFIANALLYARVDLDTDTLIELNGKEVNIPYQSYLEKKITEYVTNEYRSYVAQNLSLEALYKAYQEKKEYIEVQCLVEYQQKKSWVSCIVHRIHMSDSVKVSFLIRDIDEKKRKEIKLKEQAEKDGLTGLYNAVTTRSKIDKILLSADLFEEKQVFVLFDLDNFKKINDTFGHAWGDQVLIDIANVLKSRLRGSDIIGRLGGDEFALLLCNLKEEQYIEELIKSLIQSLTKTYTQGDVSVTVSVSAGIVIAPYDGITFEELYKKADIALYQVKKNGKNGYRRYE